MTRDGLVLLAVGVVSTAALSAVAGSTAMHEALPREPFIVFAADFAGFDRWESFSIPADKHAIKVHVEGPRTVYLNRRPDPGAVRFPVGTIIVKVTTGEKPLVFAMVKRGGGYNRGGAYGWEWFQLSPAGGTVGIQWRGTGPPNGEGYASGKDCNQCHMETAAHNDAVESDVLDLKKLAMDR